MTGLDPAASLMDAGGGGGAVIMRRATTCGFSTGFAPAGVLPSMRGCCRDVRPAGTRIAAARDGVSDGGAVGAIGAGATTAGVARRMLDRSNWDDLVAVDDTGVDDTGVDDIWLDDIEVGVSPAGRPAAAALWTDCSGDADSTPESTP